MTKVEHLRPPPERRESLPQCEAEVEISTHEARTDWRRRRYGKRGTVIDKCQRSATVKIDGKCYCRPHAGQMALRILEKETERG